MLFGVLLIVTLGFLLLIYLFTPAPKTLTSPKTGDKILGTNQWFPKEDFVQSGAAGPQISAKAALFVETKTGEVLYSKNAREKLPIASLAKVMTAIVALEYKSLEEKFSVSQRASESEPDEMLLIPGEKLSLKELLYGIFMISANDAAEVLAEGTLRPAQGKQEDREEFIKLMNSKTVQLGMKDTHFVNPTGLDEDSNHGSSNNSYSTAYDMAVLARYAIRRYPVIVDISKTPHIFIPASPDHQDYDVYSGINLLTSYPGVVGLKTGYTPEAGLTIITLAQKGEHEVLGVLLGSENRRDETRMLLDYSFGKLE